MKDTSVYIDFWERSNTVPLLSHSLGSYFVSKRFKAAEKLLEYKGKIEPQHISIEGFKSDYLRMYEEWDKVNPETVFTGVPFTGIPWMEAMLGCNVYSTGCSFMAKGNKEDIGNTGAWGAFNKDWLELYLDFTQMLGELGAGKFPVGQPIMRGPVDIAGTMLGQEKIVYKFFDCPEDIVKFLNYLADVFLFVIGEQKKYIKSYNKGYSIGFYDLWCPGGCIWFQDDLTALLSPGIYGDCILDIHKRISKSYRYSLVHLHPASLFILDMLLEIEELGAVQINKDVGGPPLIELLPQFKKVLKQKNLVLWGDFSKNEISLLQRELSPQGLYIYNFNEQYDI